MQSEELVEKVAKALALEMYPDTRWPADENDADFGVGDHEGRYPLSWHYAQVCRRQAKVVLETALSAAEPVAWMDNGDTRNGSTSTSFRVVTAETKAAMPKASADNFNTPLYAANPAPSVAVKAVAPVDVYKAVGSFIDNDTFDKDHVSAICRAIASALSAQVHDGSEIVDCLLAGKPFVFDPATNFCHAVDGGAPEHGIKYVPAAQVQDVAGSGGMEFPEALTDDLRDVLSTMLWTSGQIAACLRAGGDQIKTRAEDEQAHVLHWLISLALKHGPEWRAKASDRIKAIRDAAAPAKQEGGHD